MIGTVHLDRDSAPVLIDLLDMLMPTVIGVETSQFSIDFRLNKGRELRYRYLRFLKARGEDQDSCTELGWRIRMLSMPYEYLCARIAGRSHGIRPMHLSRNRESIAGLAPLAREPKDHLHLFLLAGLPRNIELEIDTERQRALSMNMKGIRSSIRERIMARNIGILIQERHRVVAVMGWEHLCTDIPGTAASLLSDLNPVRLLVVGGAVQWII